MQDTIIVSGGKQRQHSALFSEISAGEFNPDELGSEVKFIIKIDGNAELNDSQLSLLRENAAEGTITAGTYESGGFFSALRRIIYSFAGDIESDCAGAVIFPSDSAKLRKKAAEYGTIRLMSLASEEKLKRKSVALPLSGRKKLSTQTIEEYFSVFLSSKLLKYVFSSAAAFVIDYILLLALDKILPFASLEVGALIAWCISSFVNFTVNRKFVFESASPLKTSLVEYYSLAAAVFVLKTYALIELLTRVLRLPLAAAKPIAEVIFFVLNYFVQKLFIFKKRVEK